MKKVCFPLIFGLAVFLLSSRSWAQTPPRKAEFPGGMVNFYKWIDRNMVYPEDAKKEKIGGRVVVSFIIKENGEIWKESIEVKKGIFPSIDQEAVRLIKESPIWSPAREAELGKAVPVRTSIPINFAAPE